MTKNREILTIDQRLAIVAESREVSPISIEAEPVVLDFENQRFVFRATVRLAEETFTAHGDATRENTSRMIHPHLPRMAETRAIARALRFAGFGEGVSAEELMELPRDHHPSWEADRKRFCAKLRSLDLTYEGVRDDCVSRGWGKPSEWSQTDRERLLSDLEAEVKGGI